MFPSQLVNDQPLQLTESMPGCFTVENAYEGTYDYFGKLPRPKPQPVPQPKPETKPFDPFEL